jgi:protein involved in polysaccharide export with SLBB domain
VRALKRSRRIVTLFGAVRSPGIYELPHPRPLSLRGLLSMAKGLASEADGERLGLIRKGKQGMRCYHLSYRQLLATHMQGRDVWLEAGDQVVVSRLPDVFVQGAVERPGRLPLRPGSTVASLLTEAGLLPGADVQEVQLLKGREPARPAKRLDEAISAGMVIYVPHSLRVYVAGAVRSSGPVSLPRSQLTLLRVLGEAGWFTETADLDGTRILRAAGSKDPKTLVVPVSEILSGERSESEYPLLPGDLVTVPERRW